MRRPGIEPGSLAWKARIITPRLAALIIIKITISYNFSDFIEFYDLTHSM